MIKVVGKTIVKEDGVDEFKKIAAELIAQTREKDQGCISYQLFQDRRDSKILTFIEEWESTDALKAHSRATHFQTLFPKLEALSASQMELNIYNLLT